MNVCIQGWRVYWVWQLWRARKRLALPQAWNAGDVGEPAAVSESRVRQRESFERTHTLNLKYFRYPYMCHRMYACLKICMYRRRWYVFSICSRAYACFRRPGLPRASPFRARICLMPYGEIILYLRFVCMYVCVYVCMYVCVYVCMQRRFMSFPYHRL